MVAGVAGCSRNYRSCDFMTFILLFYDEQLCSWDLKVDVVDEVCAWQENWTVGYCEKSLNIEGVIPTDSTDPWPTRLRQCLVRGNKFEFFVLTSSDPYTHSQRRAFFIGSLGALGTSFTFKVSCHFGGRDRGQPQSGPRSTISVQIPVRRRVRNPDDPPELILGAPMTMTRQLNQSGSREVGTSVKRHVFQHRRST